MMSKVFLLIALICGGLYGFFTVQAYFHQQALEEELYEAKILNVPASGPAKQKHLQEGDLFGRLEIPRLNMSVMVMEGDQDDTLRLGVGHIPGTTLAIAGHRDSFFRPLKDIQPYDIIRLTTPQGTTDYRVVSTKIVGPEDTWVLDNDSPDVMTLITCYPFYYIGPAPQRFVVEAMKN